MTKAKRVHSTPRRTTSKSTSGFSRQRSRSAAASTAGSLRGRCSVPGFRTRDAPVERLRGGSMEPALRSGDYAVIDTAQTNVGQDGTFLD